MISTLAEDRQADRVMLMAQLQIVHTNMCQIANQQIHMLHHNAGKQNYAQDNYASRGGGGYSGGNAGAVGCLLLVMLY